MFDFKQFHIDDSHCDMKVGTDGVLLGAWTKLDNPRRVLDAGSGSGLLALMIAQRAPEAQIDAVEISEGAYSDALKNISATTFAQRITVLKGDITSLELPRCSYDLIISNPPFFTETLHSPDFGRATSRHEGEFGVEWLINHAAELLAADGSLAFIAPASRDTEIEFMIELARLNVLRRCSVIPVEGRPAKRTLWQITKSRRQSPEIASLIIRNTDQTLTSQYITLTSDFYL